MKNHRPKVTVYILSHNYGQYLRQSIESVLFQTFTDWELVLINDGSSDNTQSIMNEYKTAYPDKIKLIQHSEKFGLHRCANITIDMAGGEYIMRLDADDYLDENALLILSGYLDQHEDTGLVYPNYIYINDKGDFLAIENRKKIGQEAKFLDLPSHGACTMVRKRILKSIGGYDENRNGQDGYELWLKVLNRYPVANVSTPLFYYRQHEDSISRNESGMLAERQKIKRVLSEKNSGYVKPRIIGLIPAKNTYMSMPNVVLENLAGKPLIDYTIDAALRSDVFDDILVATDDPKVIDYCSKYSDILTFRRPEKFSLPNVLLAEIIQYTLGCMEKEKQLLYDIVVILNVHAPLRRSEHIREAVDTLMLYNADNVTSVYEDHDLHYVHEENGLVPINKTMLNKIRVEREGLYVDNGAILVLWRDVLSEKSLYGKKISHIVMPYEESFIIKSPFELWLVEKIMKKRGEKIKTKSKKNDVCCGNRP